MTTDTFQPVSDDQLRMCANQLDAGMGAMHSSAFQAANNAVKLMQKLAKNRKFDSTDDVAYARTVVAELMHFASTVARSTGNKMQSAAKLLSAILAEAGYP